MPDTAQKIRICLECKRAKPAIYAALGICRDCRNERVRSNNHRCLHCGKRVEQGRLYCETHNVTPLQATEQIVCNGRNDVIARLKATPPRNARERDLLVDFFTRQIEGLEQMDFAPTAPPAAPPVPPAPPRPDLPALPAPVPEPLPVPTVIVERDPVHDFLGSLRK